MIAPDPFNYAVETSTDILPFTVTSYFYQGVFICEWFDFTGEVYTSVVYGDGNDSILYGDEHATDT